VSPSKVASRKEGVIRGCELTSPAEHDKTPLQRLKIRIDRNHPDSVAEQVVYRIALFLVDGALPQGARMPTLDVAAQHVGVNRGVMAAAYQLLARFGLSTNTTGAGTHLTDNAECAARRYLCSVSAKKLVHQARLLDLGDDEIIGVVLASLRPDEKHTTTGSIAGEEQSR
jgi:DNA-binding transcriptional regulator YhcF (GntR family)